MRIAPEQQILFWFVNRRWGKYRKYYLLSQAQKPRPSMKKYKVVKTISAEAFENELNVLAKEGWKVISANLAQPSLDNEDTIFFALLVINDVDVELKQLLEENVDELENIDLNPSDN